MTLTQAVFMVLMALAHQNVLAATYEEVFPAKPNTYGPPLRSLEISDGIAEKSFHQDNFSRSGNDKELKIRINRGRKFTNKREIEVEIRPIKLSATLISKMKIGFQPDLSDVDWEAFKSNKLLDIPGTEGELVVYAILQDKAGNISPVERAKIIIDTTPPAGAALVINKGAEVTNDPEMRVRLSIQATDAYKMQISNTGQFNNTDWEDYVPEKNWMIGPRKEGKKTVYVRFADKATNISEPIQASIMVDLTPPEGTVEINQGAAFTNNRQVSVKIHSKDAAVVRIVGQGVKNLPYQKTEDDGSMVTTLELDSLEGQKFVKVFFRDHAGNINKQPAIDDITLDTKAPEVGLFRINQGEKYCTNPGGKVTLKIGTREDLKSFDMYVSNDKSFTDAKPRAYAPKIDNWQLDAAEDGLKHVYLKFVDKAGNVSKTAMAKVMLDRQPPVAKKIIIDHNNEWVNKGYANLAIDASGADYMEISNSPNFSRLNAWEAFGQGKDNWVLPARDGKIEIYARFKDKAGNISETISDFIRKDTRAPAGKIRINNGARFTNDASKSVSVTLSYDPDTYEMQVNETPNFNNAKWEMVSSAIDNWNLGGEDGEKRIFARYRDKAGNVSEIVAARIILDTQPPLYPSISINGDSLYTTSMDKIINLEINAEDAAYMMLSSNPTFGDSKWERYNQQRKFTLPGQDGEKEIFVKFRDEAGNISATASDKIILDRYPPKPVSFKINNGEEWTNHAGKEVTLNIRAEGATQMIVADNPEFNGASWQDYKTRLTGFELPGEDGVKTLFIAFKDEAGHKSENMSASIKLKREF